MRAYTSSYNHTATSDICASWAHTVMGWLSEDLSCTLPADASTKDPTRRTTWFVYRGSISALTKGAGCGAGCCMMPSCCQVQTCREHNYTDGLPWWLRKQNEGKTA